MPPELHGDTSLMLICCSLFLMHATETKIETVLNLMPKPSSCSLLMHAIGAESGIKLRLMYAIGTETWTWTAPTRCVLLMIFDHY